MSLSLTCFTSDDIRGKVPAQFNADIAYRVGRAFVSYLNKQYGGGQRKVVVGHDVRLSSPELSEALIKGLTEEGADVVSIGQCGTEEIYFATLHLNTDGGICVTASHNPADYNGMKLVIRGAQPLSKGNGLCDIKALVENGDFQTRDLHGTVEQTELRSEYAKHLLSYVDVENIKPLKVICNAGNGGVGAVIDALEPYLPLKFIKIHHEPDGHFPNGIPNPILPDSRQDTIDAVKKHKADLGVAWDGDFDRCFFFDENGCFIEGYYIVGLLAEAFLAKQPHAKIVHDSRLTWNTIDTVEKMSGVAIQSAAGHATIKTVMRNEDALYGGEMSAHHYFKSFSYCDNGNIPWLLVVELICKLGLPLSKLVSDRVKLFPCSGELNRRVNSAPKILQALQEHYEHEALLVEHIDGLSMSFENWRFNARMSSSEPVLRLNVESRGDLKLMQGKTQEVLALIEKFDE